MIVKHPNIKIYRPKESIKEILNLPSSVTIGMLEPHNTSPLQALMQPLAGLLGDKAVIDRVTYVYYNVSIGYVELC